MRTFKLKILYSITSSLKIQFLAATVRDPDFLFLQLFYIKGHLLFVEHSMYKLSDSGKYNTFANTKKEKENVIQQFTSDC